VHEIALAEAIVAVAEQHARGRRVARIELEIGRLRQVGSDALSFSFELVAQGTLVEGAEMVIEEVPVRIECRTCRAETRVDSFPLACSRCGGLDVQVRSGEEFNVVALELEQEHVAAVRR
jgi:hydrogenase nickel incorporation protein HypA/HybF